VTVQVKLGDADERVCTAPQVNGFVILCLLHLEVKDLHCCHF